MEFCLLGRHFGKMKQDSRFGTPLITIFLQLIFRTNYNDSQEKPKNPVWNCLHHNNLLQTWLLLLYQVILDFLIRIHNLTLGDI